MIPEPQQIRAELAFPYPGAVGGVGDTDAKQRVGVCRVVRGGVGVIQWWVCCQGVVGSTGCGSGGWGVWGGWVVWAVLRLVWKVRVS